MIKEVSSREFAPQFGARRYLNGTSYLPLEYEGNVNELGIESPATFRLWQNGRTVKYNPSPRKYAFVMVRYRVLGNSSQDIAAISYFWSGLTLVKIKHARRS